MNKIRRTAICISGQVRNLAYLRAIADSLVNIDADIFVSVWERQGTKDFSGYNSHGHLSRPLGRPLAFSIPTIWTINLKTIFPKTDLIFPPTPNITAETIQAIFPNAVVDIEREDISFEFSGHGGNSFRMLYKIWRCNSLMRKAEISAGRRYELVVRMRPDVSLNFDAIAAITPEENELYAMNTGPIENRDLGDMYWFGDSKSVEKMAGGFARAIDAQTGKWRMVHRELFDHADASGLKIIPTNFMKKSVREFSDLSPEYSQSVRRNFVCCVRDRKLNIERAGGEPFCQVVEFVLSTTLEDIEGKKVQTNSSMLISKISAFIANHPDQSVEACMMAASHLVATNYCAFPDKFEAAIYYIKMRLIYGQTDGLMDFINSLVPAFSDHKPETFALLYAFISHGEKSGYLKTIPECWVLRKENRADISNEQVYLRMLKSNRFYSWLVAEYKDTSGQEFKTIAKMRKRALSP